MWVEQKDLPWITKSDDWAGEGSTHNFGYGFATRYAFNSGIAVKLSYEHALRLPSARELLGNASTVYPNFALKPESSHNLNMGAYGNIVFDNVHRLSYEGTFFMRDVKDYIRLVISETEGLAQYGNESSVRVFGGEGEVAYSYKTVPMLLLTSVISMSVAAINIIPMALCELRIITGCPIVPGW